MTVITNEQKTTTPVETSLASMRTFLIVWAGQSVSILGSSMTGFALGVWVYRETGSATGFALTLLFNMLPKAVLAPLAGVLVDRYERRTIMIMTDLFAGIATIVTAVLFFSGNLAVWHIYLLTAVNAGAGALQGPAFNASVTQLVPKAHYGRANGMMQLGSGIGQVLAPALAGVLIASVGLWSVLLVDMATFLAAVLTLMLVRFPAYTADDGPADKAENKWWAEIWEGLRYLRARTGLLGLVLLFGVVNFFVGVAEAVLTPMILSFASTEQLGIILTIGGVGLLLGSIIMSVWGGGRRKVVTMFGAYAMLSVGVFLAGLAPSVWLLGSAVFIAFFFLPAVMSSSQAIMQAKVEPQVQGRVFALNGMVNTFAFAAAFLIAGPLADRLFEPLMSIDGLLAGSIGQIIGVGPGRGMGLMFVLMGVLATVTAVSAFAYPRIRNVERELPDVTS